MDAEWRAVGGFKQGWDGEIGHSDFVYKPMLNVMRRRGSRVAVVKARGQGRIVEGC